MIGFICMHVVSSLSSAIKWLIAEIMFLAHPQLCVYSSNLVVYSVLYHCIQCHVSAACNILTMCSSGPYCIVQLETLQQIEVHSGCKVTTFFQWMVACGFGALFLLLMVYGQCVYYLYSLSMVSLYITRSL